MKIGLSQKYVKNTVDYFSVHGVYVFFSFFLCCYCVILSVFTFIGELEIIIHIADMRWCYWRSID